MHLQKINKADIGEISGKPLSGAGLLSVRLKKCDT